MAFSVISAHFLYVEFHIVCQVFFECKALQTHRKFDGWVQHYFFEKPVFKASKMMIIVQFSKPIDFDIISNASLDQSTLFDFTVNLSHFLSSKFLQFWSILCLFLSKIGIFRLFRIQFDQKVNIQCPKSHAEKAR